MKDTNVNGRNLNTKYVVSLSWPDFKAEYSNVYQDEKTLKYAYSLCHETAGKKADFKGKAPVNSEGDE